jgi:hypothetical protein
VWWNGLNWNELDGEKGLCWWVVRWLFLYLVRGRLWVDGYCTILTEISPVSGGMARMGRALGVVRQNRSVLLHIMGFDMGFDMAIRF